MSDGKKSAGSSRFTPARITAFLDRLASGHLVFVVGLLFVVDLLVPDMLPFVDEIVLGVLTILLGRWRLSRGGDGGTDAPEEPPHKPPPKNVTPQ